MIYQYQGKSPFNVNRTAGTGFNSWIRNPKPAAPPPPTTTVQGTPTAKASSLPRPPQYINQNQTEDSVNNVLAQGYQQADRRGQLKQLDRAGISRGKGHEYIAGQEGAAAMAGAANKASEIRMEDQSQNAKMKSEFEKTREDAALNDKMTQHQKDQADWSRQFARMSAQQQIKLAQAGYNLQMRMTLLNNL